MTSINVNMFHVKHLWERDFGAKKTSHVHSLYVKGFVVNGTTFLIVAPILLYVKSLDSCCNGRTRIVLLSCFFIFNNCSSIDVN